MYRIVPRTEYGLPALVTSSDGSPRPPLFNEKWMTAHYTGTNVDYTDKVTTEVIKQIQAIFGKSKPFEYNYVIGQEENDEIYEFAGLFQAAHSAGENQDSFGVLFLLGVGERLTATMINKWRWLREVLIYTGKLSTSVIQLPHKYMPGAATACPGDVMLDWDLLLLPYRPSEEPIIPPGISKGNDMQGVTPLRVLDTRGWGKVQPQDNTFFIDGIPDDAVGALITVTAVDPDYPGYVTVWGEGRRPDVSCLNYVKDAIANTTYVAVNKGNYKLYVSSPVHILVDVLAYQK